jgi:hypothetical protein
MFVMVFLCMAVFIACPGKDNMQGTQEEEKKLVDNNPNDTWPAKPTEPVQDGAYFLIDADKAILSRMEYAVIHGDYLSLFWSKENGYCEVVRFSKNGEYYTGRNIRADISFKLFGDELTVKLTDTSRTMQTRIMQLKRDPSIVISEEGPQQLPAPPENKVRPEDNVRFHDPNFSWHIFDPDEAVSSLRNEGILGAGIEIKYAGTENFTAVLIGDFIGPPGHLFSLELRRLGLTQGTYTIRIRYLGGPYVHWERLDWAFLQRNKGTIKLSSDSHPLNFKLTVDSEGKMSAERIGE